MAGRPPKLSVVSTGKIGKEQKMQREIAEQKIKVTRNLRAPTWLNKEAKKEFNRVVKEAAPIDILDNLDLSVLVIYSNAYASYIKITNQINETDSLKDGSINHTYSELVKNQNTFIKTIMQCSGKLGLATTDRLRLVVPKSEEKSVNPYIKFLK